MNRDLYSLMELFQKGWIRKQMCWLLTMYLSQQSCRGQLATAGGLLTSVTRVLMIRIQRNLHLGSVQSGHLESRRVILITSLQLQTTNYTNIQLLNTSTWWNGFYMWKHLNLNRKYKLTLGEGQHKCGHGSFIYSLYTIDYRAANESLAKFLQSRKRPLI